MVRKSAVVNGDGPALPLDPGIAIRDDGAPDADVPDVDRIRAQLGGLSDGESRVNVYRVAPGRKDVFLCEVEPSEFNMATIQTAYGAGLYRIRVYGLNQTTGRAMLQVNQQFELGEPLARPRPGVAPDDAGPRMLRELIDEVRALRAAPVAPPIDPRQGMRDTVEMLTMLKALMPAPTPVPAALDPLQMIGLMRQMKGFGEELAGTAAPAPAPSEWAGLAGAAGALLAAMKQGQASQPAEPEFDQRQIALPHIVPPHEEQQPDAQQAENGMGMMMKFAIRSLIDAAKSNATYRTVADQMMAFASDELILSVLEPDDWFDAVLRIAPEAAAHRDYFFGLRAEILSRYPDESREGVPGEGPASLIGGDVAVPVRSPVAP